MLPKSLPSWERGLKSLTIVSLEPSIVVAPLVGAWIEIFVIAPFPPDPPCRSPRGSVD